MLKTSLMAAAFLMLAAPSGFCWSQQPSAPKSSTPGATSLTANPTSNSSATSRSTSNAASFSGAHSSSSATGGRGGAGGAGGSSTATVTINDPAPADPSDPTGGHHGGGGHGYGGGFSSSHTIANVPDVVMPSFEGGTNPCVNSIAAGGAGIGFGFGLGGSFNNSACERRALSAMLYMEGQKTAAVALLCQSENVARAMAQAGTPCPADPPRPTPVATAPAPVTAPTETCRQVFHYPMRNGHRDPNGAGWMQTVCSR